MRSTAHKPDGGFTLIELLALIVVAGLLATLLLPVLGTAMEKGKTGKTLADLRQIESSLLLYFADHRAYPPVRVSCNTSERDHWCQLPEELVLGGYLPGQGIGDLSSRLEDPFNPGCTYKYAAIGPYLLNGARQDEYYAMFVPDDFPVGTSRTGRYRDDMDAPLEWAVWSLGPRQQVTKALNPRAPVAAFTWYGGSGDHGVITRIKMKEGGAFQSL